MQSHSSSASPFHKGSPKSALLKLAEIDFRMQQGKEADHHLDTRKCELKKYQSPFPIKPINQTTPDLHAETCGEVPAPSSHRSLLNGSHRLRRSHFCLVPPTINSAGGQDQCYYNSFTYLVLSSQKPLVSNSSWWRRARRSSAQGAEFGLPHQWLTSKGSNPQHVYNQTCRNQTPKEV